MGMFDSFSGLGAGLGGILGGVGGGSKPAGTTTTTTTAIQDLPEWLKPYVTGNLDAAQGVRDSSAGFGSKLSAAAMPEYLKTVRGDYLDPASNPWLDATYRHATNLVGSGVDSRFESAGRYGSGAHQGVLQEGLNNLATNIFGGNYQTERTRQNAATAGAPTFNLGNETAALYPYTAFNSLIPGLKSTSGTSSQPYFDNKFGNILSGALAGGQLGGLLGGGGAGLTGSEAFGGFGGWAGLGGGAAETGGETLAATSEEWLPALMMMFA